VARHAGARPIPFSKAQCPRELIALSCASRSNQCPQRDLFGTARMNAKPPAWVTGCRLPQQKRVLRFFASTQRHQRLTDAPRVAGNPVRELQRVADATPSGFVAPRHPAILTRMSIRKRCRIAAIPVAVRAPKTQLSSLDIPAFHYIILISDEIGLPSFAPRALVCAQDFDC